MHHADTSLVPQDITSKHDFWNHVHTQLELLLADQRDWVTNLANASSLIYNSLLAFPTHFGDGDRAVNWCGFYLLSSLFPVPRFTHVDSNDNVRTASAKNDNRLLLGPFCGKPACQFINIAPDRAHGVCAGAYLQRRTLLVPDVDAYPGHIACDGKTKSEIVCPLILQHGSDQVMLGVLDLDCLALGGFDEEDKLGLESIADLLVKRSDW